MLFLGSYSSSKLSKDYYDKNDARFWLADVRSAGTCHVSSIGVAVGPVPWSAEGRPLEVDIGSDIGSRTSTMKSALVWTISSSRLVRRTPVRAPWMSILRRYRFPRLLMPSGFALPPVECWRGIRSSQAVNSSGQSSTVAHGGDYGRSRQLPTPAICCSRWQAGVGRGGTS